MFKNIKKYAADKKEQLKKKIDNIIESEPVDIIVGAAGEIYRSVKDAGEELADCYRRSKKINDNECSLDQTKEYEKYDESYLNKYLTSEERTAFMQRKDNFDVRMTATEFIRYEKFKKDHQEKCKTDEYPHYPHIKIIWDAGYGLGHDIVVQCSRCKKYANITDDSSW